MIFYNHFGILQYFEMAKYITDRRLFLVTLFMCSVNAEFSSIIDDAVLEKLGNFSCGEKWECPKKPGVYFPCSCDGACSIADDCCQGYLPSLIRSNTVNSSDFECIPSPLVENDGSNVLMVTKCPQDWTEERTKWLCESSPLTGGDDFQTVHVTGSDTGFMYKNQYCAKCHQESFLFWLPTVGCNESFVFPDEPEKNFNLPELLKSKSHCTIAKLSPPDGHYIRRCSQSKNLVDNCPQSWQDERIREKCEKSQGIQPVYYIGEIRLKNIYCGYCGIPDISKFECPDLKPRVRTVSVYPFSILFDINKIEQGENKLIVCSNNQVYDPFVNMCRDALCNRSMIYRNGRCIHSGPNNEALTDLDCPQILLNGSEFEITENGQLIVLNSNYVYDSGSFELIGDSHAAVCTNFTQNSTSELQYSFDEVQSILSVIGISLSILGCVLTISVYLGFRTLRNIPGKIVISLCVSLVLAYLTMLVGPALAEDFLSCKTFAILMHFFFLVAFFWMNVMAIDVWYTFAYHQAGGSSDRSSRFKFYALYVLIMASIPVIISIILNEVEVTEDFSPQYGEGICWFTRRNALLIFFGLPTLFALVANVVLFVIAAKTIYKAQKNSVRLLGKEDKSMFSIYVRLTIVMGVAYLFGILVPLYNHPAILYIFIILNTLQGLFIFISFVCTRKVLGLIRERANIWSQSRSDNSYSGSRSTTKSSALSFRPTAPVKF